MKNPSLFLFLASASALVLLIAFLILPDHLQPNAQTASRKADAVYSRFGSYQALPEWSGWCGAMPNQTDQESCMGRLQKAVDHQTSNSRPTVRAHGWKLWAAATAPLSGSGYDPVTGTSNQFGTTGCWAKASNSQPACSGVFPLWLTWPNTGVPYHANRNQTTTVGGLLDISRNFSASKSGGVSQAAVSRDSGADPDPTKIQTVNTANSAVPEYPLPPLTIEKQCGLSSRLAEKLVNAANHAGSAAQKKTAWNKLSEACIGKGVTGVVCPDQEGICDGSAFVNQGDVMIATESLTAEAWNAIQKNKLYGGTDTLKNLYNEGSRSTAATRVASWLDNDFISTKNMFWPVKGCKPGSKAVGVKGCRVRYGALPPWVPKNFRNRTYATNAEYLGYERWGKVIAIDTCGKAQCPTAKQATLQLEGVKNAKAISTVNPDVYGVDRFIHLQVSGETLENAFTATDRALLDQATIWAYGKESNGFEEGDFLVVVAMHVTTKEIDSWAFQTVWWSPMNDTADDCPVTSYGNCFGQSTVYGTSSSYSGLTKQEISSLDKLVGSTWRDHYLLSDSYGIRYEIDGTPTNITNYFSGKPPLWATQRPTGEKIGQLPVAMNVYIEPVIHPLGTNCQNCHRRAGSISNRPQPGEYPGGVGRSNYQNAQCPSLLADYGLPDKDPCMITPWAWNQNSSWAGKADNQCSKRAGDSGTKCNGDEAFPIVNTDFSWIISDGHLQKASN